MPSVPKVGLITFHHVPNFGAFLQAWSLVQVMQGLGCDVEVIDYRPPALERKGRRKGWKAYVPSLGGWRMRRFMTRQLPLTPVCTTRQEVAALVQNRRYDRLVCGSDQVWMKDDYLRFDPTYYLDVNGSTSTRCISYAPSCGSMRSYGEDGPEVKRLLSRFHAVSARDQKTIDILNSVGITDVTHVVDPTLLADFRPLTGDRPLSEDHVAVVGPMDPASARFARCVADQLRCPLVALGTRCPTADREKRFIHAGEWVRDVSRARLVLTSLFHGAALSIRFRKPFIALDAGGRGFKLVDLLTRFGLEDRFLQRGEDGRYSHPPRLLDMSYEGAEGRLKSSVEHSMAYLRAALHG